MYINKKLLILGSFLVLTAITLPVFNILHLSTTQLVRSESQVATLKSTPKNTRHVTKFKSKQTFNEQNIFENLKQIQLHSNININVLPTATSGIIPNFSYVINYGYYENAIKVAGKKLIQHDSATTSIKVGIQLLQDLTITVKSGVNYRPTYLSLLKSTGLNYAEVAPASVSYSIKSTGTTTNPKIDFVRNYQYRSGSKYDDESVHSDRIGFFDVFNLSHAIMSNIFATIGGRILFRMFNRLSAMLFRQKGYVLIMRISKYYISQNVADQMANFGTKNPINIFAIYVNSRASHLLNEAAMLYSLNGNNRWHTNPDAALRGSNYDLKLTFDSSSNFNDYHPFIRYKMVPWFNTAF